MDEPGHGGKVLAVLDRYADASVWVLEDLRLHPHRCKPSVYFGGSADDFWSSYTAKGPEEAQVVREILSDFQELTRSDGRVDFEWCTFRGIVAGRKASEMRQPLINPLDAPICCTRAEGMAKLQAIRDFWLEWEPQAGGDLLGQVGSVKIHNPLLQLTSAEVSLEIYKREVDRARERTTP